MNTRPDDAKARLRRDVIARRQACHATGAQAASEALRGRVLDAVPAQVKNVAGYWPLGNEIDCRPTLIALAARGAKVALPVVAGQGQVLIFRAWSAGDVLEPGPFGTTHPSMRAAVVEPDTLLVPLIAFDAIGHRLGYGAGYYDRTVYALRQQRPVTVIGIAYDEQEIDAVPAGPHDQRMDGVITDRRTVWFNGAWFKP